MHGLFSKFILNWQFVSAFILCLLCFSLQADSAAWTGGADDGLWTTDGNWFPENSPGAGDTATFAEAGDITQADNIIVENLNVTAGSHTFEPLIFGANNIGTATISSSGITIFGDEFLDSGTINHTGTGTTTFNGDNQVSDVNLNNGTISLGGGSLDFVDFIFGGGTLNGSGVLEGSVNVASGTISPSGNAAIGSFQTNGNFTLGASGVYELNISPVESDQIIVDGDISLVDGNTVNIIPLNGTYTIGSTYNIMTATGDITGEITNLTESHPLSFSISVVEGNVVLTVLQNESILPLVLSSLKGNSSVIGNYIYLNPQVSDGNADLTFISNSVANLSATQFLNALVDLSPLSSMALSQSTYQNNLQMAVVLDKQFQKNVRTNRARHLNNQRSKKMEFEAPCSATPKTGLFIEPIGVFYHQRQTNGPLTNSGQIGFTSYTYGAGLGYEYVIDNQFVVEGGVGYTHSNLNFDANFGNAWWSSVYVAPFFGWFNERAFGNFMVMGAFNFIRNHRRVAFPGVERVARSKYTSYDLLLRGNGGARLAMGNNFWFQPEGTLNYLTIFIPNYTEKDAGAISLNYKANVIYIMQPSFRGKLIKEYTSEKFCYAPNIYVGWLANILLKNQTSTARFRDAPDNLFFTISGYHKTTNQLVLGAEFYAQRFNQFILTSNFEVDMLSKFEVYTVKVKFEWFF